MKAEYILQQIDDFKSAGNNVYGFYVTYRHTDNINSQKWGKIQNFKSVLDEIQKAPACIQEELPITRLIIYAYDQCMVFTENPMWNCVEDDSEDSHVEVIVPYIAEDGWFGKIRS